MDLEPSSSDQTLGPLSPPFLLENFVRLLNRGFLCEMWFLLSSHICHIKVLKFDQKQTSRDIRTYQIDIQTHPIAKLTTTKQAVNNQNHHTSAYVPVLCSVDRFESTHSNFSKSQAAALI